MSHKVLFAGTFDPFTIGHLSVYETACRLFNKNNVYIGAARNPQKPVHSLQFIKWSINPVTHNTLIVPDGILVADFCKYKGFSFLVRSIRNAVDLIYEMEMCHWNKKLGIETVFVPCEESFEKISSSHVRELIHFGKNVSAYLPEFVYKRWINKPKRILVTGKICSGKSSYINNYLKEKIKCIDMDKIVKEILPKELRMKIKECILQQDMSKCSNELTEAGNICYDYITSHNEQIAFEVSALGVYTKNKKNKLNKIYEDSLIINIELFDHIKKTRETNNELKSSALKIQRDSDIIDYSINSKQQSAEEILTITNEMLNLLNAKE